MQNQVKFLKTADIKISSFLLSKGASLLKLIKDNPQKIIFCFPETNETKSQLKDYWNDQAIVNPRILFEKLDYLKDLIHRDYEI